MISAGLSKTERLEEVIRIWQPRSKEKLTLADAEEILTSVSRFFKVLRRVHEKVKNAHVLLPTQNL